MNPGEGRISLREWPLDHFIDLSRKLLQIEDVYVILMGTSGSAQNADILLYAELDDQRCINLSGKSSTKEL